MYIIHEISQIASQQEHDGEKVTMTHSGRLRGGKRRIVEIKKNQGLATDAFLTHFDFIHLDSLNQLR